MDRSLAQRRLQLQWAPAPRLQGRHAGLRAARERRAARRAQLQAAPSARHLLLRDRGALRGGRPRPGRAAHPECARDALAARRGARSGERQLLAERGIGPRGAHRRLCGAAARRFLLQDLHVAELARVRAADPAHGGSGPGAAAARPRPLRGEGRRRGRAGGRRRHRRPCGRGRRGTRRGAHHATRRQRSPGRRARRARGLRGRRARRDRETARRGRATPHARLRRLRPQPRVRRREPELRRGGRSPRVRAPRAAVEDPRPRGDRGGGRLRAPAALPQ